MTDPSLQMKPIECSVLSCGVKCKVEIMVSLSKDEHTTS